MNFSVRRLLAVVFKELRHITRDVRIFFLVTLSPAFLLFVLAYIFAFDVGNVSLGWLDQRSHGDLARLPGRDHR